MLKLKRKMTMAISLAAVAAMMAFNADAAGPTRTKTDYGSMAPEQAADKEIMLTPETKWVNVTDGETVRFVMGGKSFTWHFYTFPGGANFELSMIAPPGFVSQKIVVYVASSPNYRS
jgi:hypothetical protein